MTGTDEDKSVARAHASGKHLVGIDTPFDAAIGPIDAGEKT
jgi:hypothetical protein